MCFIELRNMAELFHPTPSFPHNHIAGGIHYKPVVRSV